MTTPETKICKGALVKGMQEGNVKFGFGCMVHPYAKILTEGNCTITFGDYNIIEEDVVIKACPKLNPKTGKEEQFDMTVGDYNHFKIGSHVENTTIQDCNIFDYKSKSVNAFIESNTILAPLSRLKEGKILRANGILLPKNKIMFNQAFDKEDFKKNIENLAGVLEHLFNAAQTKK